MLAIKSEYLCVNLNKLVALMQIRANIILSSKYKISYSQFLVLHTVSTLSTVTQDDISVHMSFTAAGVSKLVSTLEKLKLINKKINKDNKRANVVSLTDKGYVLINSALQELESELDKNIIKIDKKIMSNITNKTIKNLLTTYEKK